jgi:hypothetical protein
MKSSLYSFIFASCEGLISNFTICLTAVDALATEILDKSKHDIDEAEEVVKILSILVADGVYGPIDRLARASDVETVYLAIYEALRYILPDLRRCQESKEKKEEEKERCNAIKDVLGAFEVNEKMISAFMSKVSPRIAKRIAVEALSRGLSLRNKYPTVFSSKAPASQSQSSG